MKFLQSSFPRPRARVKSQVRFQVPWFYISQLISQLDAQRVELLAYLRVFELRIFDQHIDNDPINLLNRFWSHPPCGTPAPIKANQHPVVKIQRFKKEAVGPVALPYRLERLAVNFPQC